MTGPDFNGIACFQDGLTNAQRGKLALYLTRACQSVPDARPAALLLGDPTNRERRDQALKFLNAMPSLPRRDVIAAFARLTRNVRI